MKYLINGIEYTLCKGEYMNGNLAVWLERGNESIGLTMDPGVRISPPMACLDTTGVPSAVVSHLERIGLIGQRLYDICTEHGSFPLVIFKI